jgi:hypothetical protein
MMLYDVFYKGVAFDAKVQLPDPGPDIDRAVNANWDGHTLRPRQVDPPGRKEALAEIHRRAKAIRKAKPHTLANDATFGDLLYYLGLDIRDWRQFARIDRAADAYQALAWVEMGSPDIPSDWIWE